VPGKLSTDRLWKPPYVAFAPSPSLAWSLSAMTDRGKDYGSWDLWCIWSNVVNGMEMLPFDDGSPKEYRIYERIYKRDIWFVGCRTLKGELA
jgi:hypothetical protein